MALSQSTVVWSPTDLYYNSRLTTDAGQEVAATFSDNRPSALLSRPSDYRLSVIQFSVTTDTLPLLFVEHPPQAGASPTNTSYTFSVQDLSSGYVGTATVQWSPESSITQINGTLDDPYWYCFNMTYFVNLVNAALKTAMGLLIANVPAYAGTPAPFFEFDVTSCTCTLYAPAVFQTQANLYANELAYILFQGLPTFYNPKAANPNLQYQYLIFLQPAEPLVTIDSDDFVTREQVPGALSSWNPVKRVAFATSIPVAPEAATPQQIPGSSLNIGGGLTNQIILTDITPIVTRGDELASGSITYLPSAEFRFSDITSQASLQSIDFNIFWVDRYGSLHTLYLSHGGTCQCKILFRRKDV